MTSFDLNYLKTAPSPNTVALSIKVSTYEFGGTHFSPLALASRLLASSANEDRMLGLLSCLSQLHVAWLPVAASPPLYLLLLDYTLPPWSQLLPDSPCITFL